MQAGFVFNHLHVITLLARVHFLYQCVDTERNGYGAISWQAMHGFLCQQHCCGPAAKLLLGTAGLSAAVLYFIEAVAATATRSYPHELPCDGLCGSVLSYCLPTRVWV